MPKTLMELRDQDCRYILDDGTYCAEEHRMPGEPYCAHHAALCYTIQTRPRRRAPVFLPVDMLPIPEPVAEEEPPVPELPEVMHK